MQIGSSWPPVLETAKRIVRRLFDDVLNRGNLDVLDILVGVNYTEHNAFPGQPPGREGVRVRIEALRKAFPDIQFTLEELISEDDIVAARHHWQGTQKGPFMNFPASGRPLIVTGMDFYRIENRVIIEHWHNVDELGLMRQLGMIH